MPSIKPEAKFLMGSESRECHMAMVTKYVPCNK